MARPRRRRQLPPELRKLKRLLRRIRSITLTMKPEDWISLKCALEGRRQYLMALGCPPVAGDEHEEHLARIEARIAKALEWPADPASPLPLRERVAPAQPAPGEGGAD